MANSHRGEIDAVLDGQTYTLCLTLGALAELEKHFGQTDLTGLVNFFQNGKLSSEDATYIISAGLKGMGNDISADEVSRMKVDGGAGGYIKIVAELLTATFVIVED